MKFRQQYEVHKKLLAIEYSKTHTKRQTATEFNISLSMIYDWCNKEELFKTVHKNTRKVGCGRRVQYPIQEQQVYNTIKQQRLDGISITYTMVQRQMRNTTQGNCRASTGWLRGFKKRYNLTSRVPNTHINAKDWPSYTTGQSTPKEKIQAYKQYYNKLVTMNDYSNDCIVNMDETPVWFDNIHNKTVHLKEHGKQVAVKTTGNIRDRITTILTVTRSGRMLPPCIIQQGKSKDAMYNQSRTRYVRDGINIWKQLNKTMTSDIMVDWMKEYLLPLYPINKRKLLIMDSFTRHKTREVLDTLKRYNWDVCKIPGGCSKYLQPLDISQTDH